MLSAARRGSASIARSIRLESAAPRISDSLLPQKTVLKRVQIQPLARVRAFSLRTQFRQHAAARAQVIEKEVEEGVNAQRPPTDKQIGEAVQHGPVTRFAELLERGMVCETVVNTLTRDMGLETMTQVQSLTINESLKGIDV